MTTTYSLDNPEVKKADTKAIQARKAENARKEKISEIAGDILHNTVQMAEAMKYCGTFESQLFNIQIARLAKLAPSHDYLSERVTVKDAMEIVRQAQSIKEIVMEDALEYAEHLYDEGNY